MKLLQEIREGFASLKINGARLIQELPKETPAYIIRFADGYGVAIEVSVDVIVSERFNSCRLHTSLLSVGGENSNFLILSSAFEEYRHEFATLCAEFVMPGDDGANRKKLLDNPYEWWSKWKDLVGNTNKEQQVYNVIAEMMVLEHKLKTDKSAEWSATRMGTHDIECLNESCEVKSTIKRYGADIIISSQHQLRCYKRLSLYFCRMEESLEGISINEMKEQLVKSGYDEGKLELEIERQGFERGAHIRDKKYKLLEKRKYEVDDSFPQITQESFVGGRFPIGIKKIEYTIDLDGIKYTSW